MKNLIILAFLCCGLLALGNVFADPPPESGSWELTFEDNFDSTSLDLNKWFPGYRLGRMEYYTRLGFPNAHGRHWEPNPPVAHYVLKDGVLRLRVDRDMPKRTSPSSPCVSALTTAIFRYDEKTKEFRDEVKFKQKYGWFEVRCRVPHGNGSYTAFWLHQVGANNQEYTPEGVRKTLADGTLEIDIFELLGSQIQNRINYFNVHFTKNGSCEYKMKFDPTVDFHVWAINWEEGRITWYCDGEKIWVYEGPTPPKEMYVLIAMFQIGGWAGPIDPNMPYPLDFEIDYLRVWKKQAK